MINPELDRKPNRSNKHTFEVKAVDSDAEKEKETKRERESNLPELEIFVADIRC